jgi:hypothetical protein
MEGVFPALFRPSESEHMRLVAACDGSRGNCLAAVFDPGLDEWRANDRLESHVRPPRIPPRRQESPDDVQGGGNIHRNRHRILRHTTNLSTRPTPLATRVSGATRSG